MTEAYNAIKSSGKHSKGFSKTRAVNGDIRKKATYEAEAIVNSENAGMGWGGGISGAIQAALGTEASNVDQQRKDLMKEFNRLINEEENQSGGSESAHF